MPTPSQIRGKTRTPKAEPESDVPDVGSDSGNPIIGVQYSSDVDDDPVIEDVSMSEPFPDSGSAVDAEIVPFERPKRDDTKAKSTPPRVDDWQDWISRILIKTGSDWYLDLAFRGIDEDELSASEVRSLELQKDQRDRIAKPLAELANKLKFTRKHGRAIIASTGSLEALITLGQWVSQVNRVANKYRKRHLQAQRQEAGPNVGTGPATAPSPNGTGSGSGFRIYQPGTG